MKIIKKLKYALPALGAAIVTSWALADPTGNVIDEVAWVVGDEPIYKSEIEELYQQAQ